jgi:cephalosporin hydroxylase
MNEVSEWNFEQLERLFFIVSPYNNFPLDLHPEKVTGWHSQHPVFRELLESIRPKLYIEVGTWLGASAIHAADQLEELGLETPVICIDTWLGAQEFWTDIEKDPRYQDLQVSFGYPQVYYQFLANIMHRKHDKRILPLPQTSIIASRILAEKGISADLIYVDASHDGGDVYRDLEAYWRLLNPGGAIFGDDFDEFWPSLVRDVKDFAQDIGESVCERDGFWVIKKPVREIETGMVTGSGKSKQISRLESERESLCAQLDIMTRRAGHFFERVVELEKYIEEGSQQGRDTLLDVESLRKERDALKKTASYYFDKAEGMERHNEQLESRIKGLQETNLKLASKEEQHRQEIIRLRQIANGDE